MKKISQFSNDISKIFGKQSIKPSKKESGFKKFFRKGLYAKKNISKFEKVSTENTIIRRPQNNFPIERYQKTLGKKFLLPSERRDIDTVGGLVFSLASRIPSRGEVIIHEKGIEFEVLEADPRKIKKVRIRLPNDQENSLRENKTHQEKPKTSYH